jgi:hypothetical protein
MKRLVVILKNSNGERRTLFREFVLAPPCIFERGIGPYSSISLVGVPVILRVVIDALLIFGELIFHFLKWRPTEG